MCNMWNRMTHHHKWSEYETKELIDAIRIHGLDWKSIQYFYFPHLTPQIVKNKYYKKQKNDKNGSIRDLVEQRSGLEATNSHGETADYMQLDALLQSKFQRCQTTKADIYHYQQPFDISNRYYSLPWTRNQSLPMSTDMSLVDENEYNPVIDSKQLNSLLLHLSYSVYNPIFSPPMLSPTREKSENK